MSTNGNQLNRRQFIGRAGAVTLGLGLAPSLLTACDVAGSDDSGSKVRVALGWIKNVEFAGEWLALEHGDYEKEGVTATFNAGGPNAPLPTVAVAAGDADIGIEAGLRSLMDTIQKGNEFVILGATFQRSPEGVLSLAKRPVRTARDLVGARILGPDKLAERQVEAILKVNGLPPDYTFTSVGFAPDPLLEGQGDAYSCFVTNQPITLEQKGMKEGHDFFVATYAELGLPSYADIVFARREWVAKNHDLAARFLRATIRGWERNQESAAVAANLVTNNYGADLGLDVQQQTRQNELQIPLTQSSVTREKGLFWVDLKEMSGPMYEGIRAAGRANLPEPAAITDLSVLRDAYGGRTSLL